MTYLSIITVIVLLICQHAALLLDDLAIVLSLIAVHAVGILLSALDSRRRDGTFVPQYSRVTRISDAGHAGGKAISMQHDDVLIGSLVGGLFFGIPVVTQLCSSESAWKSPLEIASVVILVAVTPATLYFTWKRLRHVLWTLPLAAVVYAWLA